MADPATLMSSLAAELESPEDRYTLEFSLPGRSLAAKRRYQLDAAIFLPLVKGIVHLERGARFVEGRVVLLERHRKPHQGEGWHKGEYVFTVQGSPEEIRVEFDLSFTKGLGEVITSFLEAVSPHESDDLCRRLARLLLRVDERVERADSLCDRLAEAEDPAGRLAHAEALWVHARLLLLIGQDAAGAERAAEGSSQVALSGLPTSPRMSQSGEVLASALRWFRRREAAERVRRCLLDAPADGREA
ncbi:hypothetical protein [Streptomyces sp. WMMC940]|uniref:hypothetical protein n=1 Tax=Streptomyces sp. WMMC940 TaxID=3015153 RepID=UPI0022B6CAB6|nr:hypothetical protein [Streptomyces sp. WMMC940]MCZ7460431.1 hypothetical protein [Streptomyces sp. WMMC940]